MLNVDLTVLSTTMLDGLWDDLLKQFAAAKDACDHEAAREVHLCIQDVIEEYAARNDAWIAQHST